MITLRFSFPEIRPLMKQSWGLGWPIVFIMFFNLAIGLTDVYVAGFLGTDVLAAVGYVSQLYWTLQILANGITVGTVSMVSQAYSAKAFDGVGNITSHSLFMALGIAGALTVAAGLYPGAIVRLTGMPSEIQSIAEAFVRIYSLVLIPSYVVFITAGILRSSDRVQIAMVTAFISAAANVVGDFVLAFGWGPIPALGYRGIAWSSAIATSLGMVLNVIFVSYGPAGISLESLRRPLPKCFRNLIKLGVPSAIQQTAWNAGTLVVFFLLGRIEHGEVTALASITAGLRIEAIIFLPIFAFNMAAAVLAGNRLGVGDVEGARSVAKATALLCLSIITVPALLIFIFAPHISTLLTKDPAVLTEMTQYLRVNMVGMPFMAVGVSLAGALQGAGDTLGTMRIVITGMWVIRLPLILVAIYWLHAGAVGVWWSMTGSVAVMCGLFVRRFYGGDWTTASIDKRNNTMLWESCLEKSR